MPRDVPSERHSWLLRRRSMLGPRQMKQVFILLAIPTLLLATVFLWWGYWYMLAYALLELAALGACLRHYARHVADYDRIEITPGAIVIEQRRARRCLRMQLHPWSTRVLAPAGDDNALVLEDRNGQVALGGFLNANERHKLAAELQHWLPAGNRTG
jgi:uncharacterized membrane protein